MLTSNADSNGLICQFFELLDRIVVILPPDSYDAWLQASMDLMRIYTDFKVAVY